MILNPFFIFSFVWLLVLFLYSLGLSQVLTPLNQTTVLLVIGSIFSFFLGWFFVCVLYGKLYLRPEIDRNFYCYFFTSKNIVRRIIFIGYVWGFGALFEVFFFRGIPLLSLFGIGSELSYVDFGISGLHGALNSLYLVLVTFIFVRQLFVRSKLGMSILIFLMLWPILLMTRQLMFSVVVQMVFLYIFFKPLRFTSYLWLFLASFITVILFGYIGDLRSGGDAFLALASPSFDYPDSFPSGFMWVYIYLVSPLNNINYNILSIEPYYFPVNITLGIFPSLVRDYISSLFGIVDQIELVNSNLNVSSLFSKLLQDFGVFFTPFFIFIISVFSFYLMGNCRRKPGYFFALVIVLHGLLFSVFSDLLFHLVFIFEFLTVMFVFRVKRKLGSDYG